MLNRRQWGRILSIILAVFAGLGALLFLLGSFKAPGNLLFVVIFGGYSVLVFVVMLKQEYAAEFK